MIKQRVYCVFEGAGARGLAHVAAYKALSRDDIAITGFAGTSAGAIVASLACAGYSADEIYSVETGASILDRLDLDPDNDDPDVTRKAAATPINFLGETAWRSIRMVRRVLRALERLRNLPKEHDILFAVAVVLSGVVAMVLLLYQTTLVLHFLSGLAIVFAVAAVFLLKRLSRGLVELDQIKRAIDQLLSIKIENRRRGAPLTFGDLAAAGAPPLKIVAANLSEQRLELFSATTTPQTAISDAVCASICLPAIFARHRIGANEYLDGGLVSNLPAWAFDDERQRDRDALTAAIEILQKSEKQASPSSIATFATILKTIVFGRNLLNTRGVDRLTTTTMEVDLGLLDFDLDRLQADEIIRHSTEQCRASLIYPMIDLPMTINRSCIETAEACSHIIPGGSSGKVRIAIGIPVLPAKRSMRLEFSSGYDDLADERLVLPIDRSFMGMAWREGESVFAPRRDRELWNGMLNAPEDRWIRKLIWPDMRWLLCVPVPLEGSRLGSVVVSLDSDVELDLSDEEEQLLMEKLEHTILERLAYIGDIAEFLPDDG